VLLLSEGGVGGPEPVVGCLHRCSGVQDLL